MLTNYYYFSPPLFDNCGSLSTFHIVGFCTRSVGFCLTSGILSVPILYCGILSRIRLSEKNVSISLKATQVASPYRQLLYN